MAIDIKISGSARKLPPWLALLVGVGFGLVGAVGLWGAANVTLRSVPATAKVIEHHTTAARSASVIAQVQVTVPGERPFRTDVEDGFGIGQWVDGGTIDLVCTRIRSGYPHCELDSTMNRWLWPLVFFAIGVGSIWWWWRRRAA